MDCIYLRKENKPDAVSAQGEQHQPREAICLLKTQSIYKKLDVCAALIKIGVNNNIFSDHCPFCNEGKYTACPFCKKG